MKRIKVLDCTLRDGGYVNDFRFGWETMKSVVALLCAAKIDIVECGFLRAGETDREKSLFSTVEAAGSIIGAKTHGCMYVAMLQYGAMEAKDIPACDGTSVDGIRVSFHEYEVSPALRAGNLLAKKGYKVFLQPVGTIIYTDKALVELVQRANEIHPYAFYIVVGRNNKRDRSLARFLTKNSYSFAESRRALYIFVALKPLYNVGIIFIERKIIKPDVFYICSVCAFCINAPVSLNKPDCLFFRHADIPAAVFVESEALTALKSIFQRYVCRRYFKKILRNFCNFRKNFKNPLSFCSKMIYNVNENNYKDLDYG